MRAITSPSNPGFRRWLELASSPRAVRESGLTLAEGVHLIEAAAATGQALAGVLVRAGGVGAQAERLLQRLGAAPVYEVAAPLYDRLSPVERGAGVIAVVATGAARMRSTRGDDALYIDGLQDPGNAGALVRVAAGAGIKRVLCSPGTTAMWAPKALRAGQGAHFAVDIVEGVEVQRARELLDGCWIGTAVRDAQPLWTVELPSGPIGWMVGAEGQGLSAAARSLCTRLVRIPTAGAVESLNVVAAAAVCLFERARRRCAGPRA